MRKRLSIFVALVLTMIMSISVAMAEYKSEGSIVLPAASATTKNAIVTGKQDAYAWTHGSTNTYVSVVTTAYYYDAYLDDFLINYVTKASGSMNANNDAPDLSGNSYYYKVKSTHTASHDDDSASMILTTIAP